MPPPRPDRLAPPQRGKKKRYLRVDPTLENVPDVDESAGGSSVPPLPAPASPQPPLRRCSVAGAAVIVATTLIVTTIALVEAVFPPAPPAPPPIALVEAVFPPAPPAPPPPWRLETEMRRLAALSVGMLPRRQPADIIEQILSGQRPRRHLPKQRA